MAHRYSARNARRKDSSPQLIAALAVIGLLLFGGSVWYATQSDGGLDRDVVVEPDAEPELAPVPTRPPPTPEVEPAPEPAKPAADPYAELQKELAEPLPVREIPRTQPQEDPLQALKSEDPEDAPARDGREPVKVKRVVDGDTLHLQDGRKVRLIGINTPERGKPLYGEARECLVELTESGELTLELGIEPKDRYGRTLAYLFAGETLVNGEIVRRGLAYCYTWRPNDDRKDELLALQREARAAKAGLWGLEPPRPASVYVSQRNGHHFHREDCFRTRRIRARQRISHSDRNAALDLGLNPCDDCDS